MFPALAGMNRVMASAASNLLGVPRARGDEPLDSRLLIDPQCVFPALAGMNRDRPQHQLRLLGVPRARGDEP